MFTGLVQDIGVVRGIDGSRGDLRIEIETQITLDLVEVGASICCSGICLTIVDKSKNSFFVDVSKESIDRSTVGVWEVDRPVNLEPSLRVGDSLGGHFVYGHVDAVANIMDIRSEGDSHRVSFAMTEALVNFIVPKGSIAIDGVSLTVNEVTQESFDVNIIPHTWKHTTLGKRKVGDYVNIEIDMLARYVARMMGAKHDLIH